MNGLLISATLSLSVLSPVKHRGDDPVKVTVVVVLATTKDDVIDPKLAELAKEVRKRDPKLTGFKLAATESKSVHIGKSINVPLVEKQELKVTVESGKDENGRISLTIKPPELGEITYACACDKYFPVVTPYQTSSGEQLIIAIMAKPCNKKK